METLKVLVVDDEPGIRSGIVRILNNFTVGYPFMDDDFNFQIIEAETGEKGLKIMEQEQIDIVLLDNKLPGMDGIEVLDIINKKKYDVSVMMITSYASLDLAVKATNIGAYNFVPKPFTPQELKSSVENITKNLFLKRMTRKMNEEGREVRFQFLSVLSHELKSPINAVEGYLRIMQERQAGTDLADYENMIERSIERLRGMRSLIMDLLDLTKIENGEKSRVIEKVDICEIARMAIQSVEPLSMQKNLKIWLDAPEQLWLDADRGEIEIILNNLISNAVKYNKTDGSVNVIISNTPSGIILSIEDTGIGMSDEDISHLFQDFVRIKNEKTRKISGSGLGLSIVKKMLDLYGGNIQVQSTPDKGSKFSVFLPKSY